MKKICIMNPIKERGVLWDYLERLRIYSMMKK